MVIFFFFSVKTYKIANATADAGWSHMCQLRKGLRMYKGYITYWQTLEHQPSYINVEFLFPVNKDCNITKPHIELHGLAECASPCEIPCMEEDISIWYLRLHCPAVRIAYGHEPYLRARATSVH